MRLSARRLFSLLPAITLIGFFAGCGTNFEQVLIQTAGAAGRTALDVFLTELANELADELAGGGTGGGDDQDEQTDGGNGDGDDEPANGDLGDLTGDAANGAALYTANNCGGCHCADGSGGCALNAPSLVGDSRQMLDDVLRGTATHPLRANLTDQEIVDLEAYLASL